MSEVPEPALSAYDRVQSRGDEPSGGTLSWRGLAAVLAVVAIIVGLWFWTHREPAGNNSLLRQAVAAAATFHPERITDDPDFAASYVMENLEGWLVFPPELDTFQLLGVGKAELGPAVFVPAYRYDDVEGNSVIVFAYDYILLDEAAAEGRLQLAPAVYARLAEPEPVDIRRQGDAYTVTWRRRATLFTAVAPGEDLAERLSLSVRQEEL